VIIDAFVYWNEADLAEVRIRELKDVVDKFIILTATTTFMGNPNVYEFPEHLHDIADVEVHHFVFPYGLIGWDAEFWLRHQLKDLLRKFSAKDIVIFADADEIVRASVAKDFDGTPYGLEIDQYYYNFQTYMRHHTCMFTSSIENINDVNQMRFGWILPIIETAGWEFSFFSDAKGIREKIQNYSHAEINIPEYTDLDKIQYRMDHGIDIVDRPITGEPKGPLPEWVVNNKERLKRYWREDVH
jgi:hypothetical protein